MPVTPRPAMGCLTRAIISARRCLFTPSFRAPRDAVLPRRLPCRARRVSDGMFLAAARALAKYSPALPDRAAPLLPALTAPRRAAVGIARAVGEQAQREGLCLETSPESLRNAIISSQWVPVYPSYI